MYTYPGITTFTSPANDWYGEYPMLASPTLMAPTASPYPIYATPNITPVSPYVPADEASKKKVLFNEIMSAAVKIVLATGIVYLFSLGGGAVIMWLEDDEARQAAQATIMAVQAQGFSTSQLAYLKGLGIPDPYVGTEHEYNLLNSQFYCATLITTVGYGTFVPATAAAIWFMIPYCFVFAPITILLLIWVGWWIFDIVENCLLLLVDVFLDVKYGPGLAEQWTQRALAMFDMLDASDSDKDGTIYLHQVRQLMTAVTEANKDYEKPDWDLVCEIAMKADKNMSGDISKDEIPALMKEYALKLADQRRNQQIKVLVFKIMMVVIWFIWGAWWYSAYCPCLGNFGTAFYFEWMTLTAPGMAPCSNECRAFWFVHTCWAIGMTFAVFNVVATHILHAVRTAKEEHLDLSPEYTYQIAPLQISNLLNEPPLVIFKAVAIIMAYICIGGAIFHGFEWTQDVSEKVAARAEYEAQGFTPAQRDFLSGFAAIRSCCRLPTGMGTGMLT
mmetsp:Transcript_126435/g.219100  ORF Transcript_126435/g.219100 Transcript_126435/m.219100 type:complete len:502 (-) Transcript_126435:502-2007(-)